MNNNALIVPRDYTPQLYSALKTPNIRSHPSGTFLPTKHHAHMPNQPSPDQTVYGLCSRFCSAFLWEHTHKASRFDDDLKSTEEVALPVLLQYPVLVNYLFRIVRRLKQPRLWGYSSNLFFANLNMQDMHYLGVSCFAFNFFLLTLLSALIVHKRQGRHVVKVTTRIITTRITSPAPPPPCIDRFSLGGIY